MSCVELVLYQNNIKVKDYITFYLVSCVELVLELGETSGDSSFSAELSGLLDKIYKL